MQIRGSSLARSAVIAFSTMLPFVAGCDQHKTKQIPVLEQKQEEKLPTQGFLINFDDSFTLTDIKKSLHELKVVKVKEFDRPKNVYYIIVESKLLWNDLAKLIKEANGVERVGTPPINPDLPDITNEFNEVVGTLHTYRLMVSFKDRPTQYEAKQRLKPLSDNLETWSMDGPIADNVYLDFDSQLSAVAILKLCEKIKEVDRFGFTSNIIE